ncbi:MAG: FG-GAP repeat domain-containing protein [Mariniblastus sp.]
MAVSPKKKPAEPVLANAPEETLTPEQQKIKTLSDSETLIQSLATKLKMVTLALTDDEVETSKFAGPLSHSGLSELDFGQATKEATESHGSMGAYFYWPMEGQASKASFAEVLGPLLERKRFEDIQIGVLKGSFVGTGADRRFEMQTKIEGRLGIVDGRVFGAKSYQTLSWQQAKPDEWMLVGWTQEKLKLISSPQSLFEDVTELAIPDEDTRKKLARSSHQALILENSKKKTQTIKDARSEFKAFSDWESAYQYPAASVVDIDQDGFDDLFVTDRWQSAQLLRNKGDGTFEDITESSGLLISELANCSYFFDFDNDGDSDVFVGKTLGPSQFFINDGGKFSPHEAINEVLKESRFVVSGSVADVNRDGLLDLYLSTYAYGSGDIMGWIDQAARPEDRLKTRKKFEKSHSYVDRVGPPNILLMNRGGTFEWTKVGDELKQYRDSYQSAWTDFDNDGDADLYICNDFSPDVFLRNDTQRGSFKVEFVDVTSKIAGAGSMGFGMGASWGDFNNDGDLDLYVSNMYSKAGTRIVAQLDDVDERVKVSARGNFLYENDNGNYKQIAGTGDSDQHVSSVGWSFGGQFADFDNDGKLDLYVPSGFYSAPRELRNDVDL